MQCTARRKRGGECKALAVQGRDKCRMHGGTNMGGPLKAGGRYSRYLPKELGSVVEERLADPDLLSLKEEIAIHQARLGQLLERLDWLKDSRGGDVGLWQQIREETDHLRRLSETEAKRLTAAQQVLTAQQLQVFLRLLADVIERNVPDVDTRRAIAIDFARSFGRPLPALLG